MKIVNLNIQNFRGIRKVSLTNLGGMVIIAGQNGSGKSCIFDAIRLLKSTYGGYQANEWQQWMGEFQINLASKKSDFATILNDPDTELRISCEFKISQEERQFIEKHAEELLTEKIWRTILPDAYNWGALYMARFAAQFRDRQPEVVERVAEEKPMLIEELTKSTITGECFIPVGGQLRIHNSVALSLIFSLFRPQNIGVIDYHGAQRHYGRENVKGINLSLNSDEQKQSQSALYNYANKYNNVKSEMASSYVQEILAEKAGIPRDKQSTLTNTLKELFTSFFPDKEFLGPQPTPDGNLSFPVKIGENIHDLDELSAGEKEILYGYLRIRNSAPKHSIVLLDEPELHLNPRLIRGLPQFYKANLGEIFDNQIWLVTHSDALLREVVGLENYNVFHMLPCTKEDSGMNQLKELSIKEDLDLALIDLVGDLAAYHPGGKVIIFEGGGDSDFDQKMVATLFPEVLNDANLVSGSNKSRVRALHETLHNASQKGQLPFKYFSITDLDSEHRASAPESNIYTWDVYHIENYFLDVKYLLRVLSALELECNYTEAELWDLLRECARETLPQLVRHKLIEFSNNQLVALLKLEVDPKAYEMAVLVHESISRSLNKMNKVFSDELSRDNLKLKESDFKQRYESSLANGSWVQEFRGRDVLKRFVSKHTKKVSYEVFRNLLLSQMATDGYQPEGMKKVIGSILSS